MICPKKGISWIAPIIPILGIGLRPQSYEFWEGSGFFGIVGTQTTVDASDGKL